MEIDVTMDPKPCSSIQRLGRMKIFSFNLYSHLIQSDNMCLKKTDISSLIPVLFSQLDIVHYIVTYYLQEAWIGKKKWVICTNNFWRCEHDM